MAFIGRTLAASSTRCLKSSQTPSDVLDKLATESRTRQTYKCHNSYMLKRSCSTSIGQLLEKSCIRSVRHCQPSVKFFPSPVDISLTGLDLALGDSSRSLKQIFTFLVFLDHATNLIPEPSLDDFTRRTYKLNNTGRRCMGPDPLEDDLTLHHNGDNASHFLPRCRHQSNTVVTGEYEFPQSKTDAKMRSRKSRHIVGNVSRRIMSCLGPRQCFFFCLILKFHVVFDCKALSCFPNFHVQQHAIYLHLHRILLLPPRVLL